MQLRNEDIKHILLTQSQVTSEFICNLYQLNRVGQQLLFEDYDDLLLNTEFKSLKPNYPNLDKKILIHWFMKVNPYLEKNRDKISKRILLSWQQAVTESYKYIDLSRGGDHYTEQPYINLRIPKSNSNVTEVMLELLDWLPYIKPMFPAYFQSLNQQEYKIYEIRLRHRIPDIKEASFSYNLYILLKEPLNKYNTLTFSMMDVVTPKISRFSIATKDSITNNLNIDIDIAVSDRLFFLADSYPLYCRPSTIPFASESLVSILNYIKEYYYYNF